MSLHINTITDPANALPVAPVISEVPEGLNLDIDEVLKRREEAPGDPNESGDAASFRRNDLYNYIDIREAEVDNTTATEWEHQATWAKRVGQKMTAFYPKTFNGDIWAWLLVPREERMRIKRELEGNPKTGFGSKAITREHSIVLSRITSDVYWTLNNAFALGAVLTLNSKTSEGKDMEVVVQHIDRNTGNTTHTIAHEVTHTLNEFFNSRVNEGIAGEVSTELMREFYLGTGISQQITEGSGYSGSSTDTLSEEELIQIAEDYYKKYYGNKAYDIAYEEGLANTVALLLLDPRKYTPIFPLTVAYVRNMMDKSPIIKEILAKARIKAQGMRPDIVQQQQSIANIPTFNRGGVVQPNYYNQGGAVMQPNNITGKRSLREMIDSYRRDLKSGGMGIPALQEQTAPAVQYGDPMAHPGQPQGQDTVPIWAQPGEFVMNQEATQTFGPQIEAMNNQGRAMQDQNNILDQNSLPQHFAIGGEVVAQPSLGSELSTWAGSQAGADTGTYLQKIGWGGQPAYGESAASGSATAASTGNKYWIDPQTGAKYYTRTNGGVAEYVQVGTNNVLTDQAIISRLNQVGTEGSGAAGVGESPEKMYAKQLTDKMKVIAIDGRKAIDAGAGFVVDVIKSGSTSPSHYLKVLAAAKAAGGTEAIYRDLDALIQDNYVMKQVRNNINAFYDLMKTISEIEVLASQASGEQRLTDEDAKRYLAAMMNPNATPEGMLKALGQIFFESGFEAARKQEWNKFINTHAQKDQLNEYWFNTIVWNARSEALLGQRSAVIQKFVDASTYEYKEVDAVSLDEDSIDGEDETVTLQTSAGNFSLTQVKKGDIPKAVVKTMKKIKGVDVGDWKNVVIVRDSGVIYVLADMPGDYKLRIWFTAVEV